MPVIIGLVGKKYSGKDTCAEYMIRNYGFKRMAFADPLKLYCKKKYELKNSQLEEDKDKLDMRWGVTPREMFKDAGMKGREFDRGYWVNKVRLDVLNSTRNSQIVITDVRFENEATFIKNNGGILVQVQREECDQDDDHVSEKEMDSIKTDYSISNNSTLKCLNDTIDMVLDSIYK